MEIKNDKYNVYVHTTPSGKYYVGITGAKPSRRWRTNGNGYKKSSYFYKAILKYGWDKITHEITASNLTEDEAKSFEILLIEKLNSNDKKYGYNLTLGGDGVKGYACPQSKKDTLSVTMSGENNPMYGIHLVGRSGADNPMYGAKAHNRKKVLCVTTDEVFECVTHASKKYKTYNSDINKVCNGLRKYAGTLDGVELIWRYV